MRKLFLAMLIGASAVNMSCGSVDQDSNVAANSVKLKIGIAGKFLSAEDLLRYSQGEEVASVSEAIASANALPGVLVTDEEIRNVINSDVSISAEQATLARESEQGIALLKELSLYVHTYAKRGNSSDFLEGLTLASKDARATVVEMVSVWPSETVVVDVIRVLNRKEAFTKLLTDLQNLGK